MTKRAAACDVLRAALSLIALAWGANSVAFGQSFNIDFGTQQGVPPSSYGGHFDWQPGTWHPIVSVSAAPQSLSNIIGVPTTVTLASDVRRATSETNITEPSNNDHALMYDGLLLSYNTQTTFTFTNLKNGRYRVFVGSWGAESNITFAVSNADPPADTVNTSNLPLGIAQANLDWAGFAPGQNYVEFLAQVFDGTLTIFADSHDPMAFGYNALNGIQLELVTQSVSTAAPPGGNYTTPTIWDTKVPPNTTSEVCRLSDTPIDSVVTLAAAVAPFDCYVADQQSLVIGTGGRLSTERLHLHGSLELNDTSSIGGDTAVLETDIIDGQGTVRTTSNYQNVVRALTPGESLTVGGGIAFEVPVNTKISCTSGLRNYGTLDANGGHFSASSQTIDNFFAFRASGGGSQAFTNCTIDNTFGLFEANSDALITIFDSNATGGTYRAIDGGHIDFCQTFLNSTTIEAVADLEGSISVTDYAVLEHDNTIGADTTIDVIDAATLHLDTDNLIFLPGGKINVHGRFNSGLGSHLRLEQDFNLQAPGFIRLVPDNGTANARVVGTGVTRTFTIEDGATYGGAGRALSTVNFVIEDGGEVIANEANQPLRFDSNEITNNGGTTGGLFADNGGQLRFFDVVVTSGNNSFIHILDNATMLAEFCTFIGGEINTGPFATAALNNTILMGVVLNGNFVVSGNSNTDTDHTNTGITTVAGNLATSRVLNLIGSVANGGGGALIVTGDIEGGSNDTLNNVDQTIGGDGTIGFLQVNNNPQATIQSTGLSFNQAGVTLNNDGGNVTVNPGGSMSMSGASILNNNPGGSFFGGAGAVANIANFNNAAAVAILGSGLAATGGAASGGGGGAGSVAGGPPPNPTGTFTLNGNYTQEATGSLEIDLAGLIAGDEYDQLIVSGNASLDGDLIIRAANGFQWQIGDTFTILTAGTVTGEFNLATCSGMFNVTYNDDSVVLTAMWPLKPGDTNCSGSVDVTDLLMVIASWGACADCDNCPADVAPETPDCAVNVSDLLTVIANWG